MKCRMKFVNTSGKTGNIKYMETILKGVKRRIVIVWESKTERIGERAQVVIKRGDVYYADLRPVVGSEQGGVRPVLIIQNDIGNRHSPTVICAAITSRMNKAKLPTHVELSARMNKAKLPTHIEIEASAYGIVRDSVILLEQLRTIDKRRLKDKICHLTPEQLALVNEALKISLDLPT